MPVVATNAPTIAIETARSAVKANNSVQAKDNDDNSFSDMLTKQTAPEKTDASPKSNSTTQTNDKLANSKSANGKQAGTQSSGTVAPGAKTLAKSPHLMSADNKSAAKKTNSIKQDQHDAQKDPADNPSDAKVASNRADKPISVPASDADGNAADPDQSGNDTGSQTQSDSGPDNPGKDAAPSVDALAPAAPDLSTLPPAPVQQANTDAMAQAAATSLQAPMAQTSAPALPPSQDIATGGIGAGRPRARLPDAPRQSNTSSPRTLPETDSDSDPTPSDAVTAGSAPVAAPQTLQAAAISAPISQDDSDQDDATDATLSAAPVPDAGTTALQAAASSQASTTIAPPSAGPASRSGAAAPRTLTAQNNKPATPDTAPPGTTSPTTTSKNNQPLNPDGTVQTAPSNAPQPPKTTESNFKFAVAKTSDQQSADAPVRADADSNAPATPAAAPQPVQPPTPGPASPMLALANAGAGASQAVSNSAAPTATANIHVGPQSADVKPNVNGLAVEIAAKSQSGARQFDIRLDPPELGRVEVRLSIDASGKAEAHMTADQPQTLHLLQKDSDTLTRALRDAGLDVSQDGLNFSLRGQDRQNGNGQNDPRGGTATRALQATKTIESMPANTITYSSAGNARLDIHV